MSIAIRSKTYNLLSNGEAIEMKSDDANLQRLFKQVTYVATYMTFDKDGVLGRPSVGFTQSDMGPVTTITITSPVDARRQVTESYRNGALHMRSRLKDGLNHGWMETAPGQPPMCFQNGKIVKAEVCPDT